MLPGNEARLANRELVNARIAEVVATAPAEHWVATISAAARSASSFATRRRLAGPAARERGLVGEPDPGLAELPMPVVSLARPGEARPGPRLGEHTDEVQAEL